MKLKNILIGSIVVLVFLFLGLIAVVAYLFLSETDILPTEEKSPAVFTVLETGTAGEKGYAVFNYRGSGNVTALVYDAPPKKSITIINDPQAIHASKLDTLVEDLRQLEKYGYTVAVTNQTVIGSGIYIVPSGAIPSYVLFNLQQGSSTGTVFYIGEKDLLLSRGIKRQEWYDALSDEQRERIVQYDGTLDDFIESENYTSMVDDILYQSWSQKDNSSIDVTGAGITTIVTDMNGSYLRLIYELDEELYGISDSGPLSFAPQFLEPEKESIYPWQSSRLEFGLNKTSGTPSYSVEKDGKVVDKAFLRRVTDDNVFVENLEYDDPGEYILKVEDNTGQIASGYLHIKDLEVDLMERHGIAYVFSVTVDGEPLENTDIYVGLGESEKRKLYVSDGTVTVNAKLNPGTNTFNFDLLGHTVPVEYENTQEGFLDVYIKYGIPGILIVAVVYFGARLSRKPMFRLRFGESATYIRQEIRIPTGRAVESFKKIRQDMNLGRSPITPQEFAMSLKRYLTNGADVTEGNVEEILKKLVDKGYLEGHRDYYQLKGEGDIKRNTLRRMARENLIESGTMFKDDGEKFITKDYEIGFFGQKFSKNGIIVVDDKSEIKRIIDSLSGPERSKMKILQANGKIKFVPIGELSDVL